jgi:hypothetical protein
MDNTGYKLYTLKYLLILTLFIPLTSSSQKIGDGVINIYNSVGIVTYNTPSGNTSGGTGTLIYKEFPGGGMKIFLVTCKHVLPVADSAKQIQFAIHNDSSKTSVSTLTIDIFDSLKRYLPYVKFDPSGNDVTAIDITTIFLSFPLKNLQSKPIPYTLLATRDSLYSNNVHVGDQILFTGYPNFYFNTKTKTPIMRAGVIATPPEEVFYFDSILIKTYTKAGVKLPGKFDGFLIDGNQAGGLSGSLIFLKPQFLRNFEGAIEKSITTSDPMILGILTDSYFSVGQFENPRINLGGVISADAIKRTIDLFVIK